MILALIEFIISMLCWYILYRADNKYPNIIFVLFGVTSLYACFSHLKGIPYPANLEHYCIWAGVIFKAIYMNQEFKKVCSN